MSSSRRSSATTACEKFMETKEPKNEKSRLELLRETIAGAARRIEEEFSRTENSWPACFGSSVFVVETYLFSPKVEASLSPEQYQLALKRLEDLKERLYELKQQYPEKETMPPEDVKKELLFELDVLRDG